MTPGTRWYAFHSIVSYGGSTPSRDLPDAERRARCRTLQGIVRLLAGPRCPAVELLRQAEDDAGALADCDRALDQLPTRIYRSALCTFAATLPSRSEATAALREVAR